MSNFGRALGALLSNSIEKHSTSSQNQSEMKQKDLVEPEKLSAMALVYAVYAEEGNPIVGSPSAGFAYFVESTDTLVVVNADLRKIEYVSLDSVMANDAMETAQELGASFMTYGTQVVCNIKGISQAGSSYAEAAMRAILASVRLEKSVRINEESA